MDRSRKWRSAMKTARLQVNSLAALLAVALCGQHASAADDAVAILSIWPFSGPYADVGPLLDNGARWHWKK
jgi:hypothetical protein